MNNIQLMEIIQQYKNHSATIQDVENAVKEFEADVKKQNDGWISVQDRTPDLMEGKDYSENVLAILDGNLAVMCFAWTPGEYEEGGGYYWANCYGDINGDPEWDDDYNPTYWQPLPALNK
jgi:hypothetical protein